VFIQYSTFGELCPSLKKGYIPYGLDFTEELPKMKGNFSQHGIQNLTLISCDFEIYEPRELFDVVCSFGFIEHFKKYDEILEKHITLVKPGGYLILSCPNFTHTQYWLHYLLDYENLSAHEISVMNLEKWETILRKHNMELLYHDYYRTTGFWVDDPENTIKKLVAKGISYSFFLLDRWVNYPNAYTSPYMISVSKKSESNL
jgi:2-polyprenyl-3-methyl-5-hydroxy-6-metoxy-1,4-benzoquinol methylase